MSDGELQLELRHLDELRDGLRQAGAPLGKAFGPGLTDDEIDGLSVSLGVQIPTELRTLWKWASPPAIPATPDLWDVNPEFELWPAATAVERTLGCRRDPSVPTSAVAFAGPGYKGYLTVGAALRNPSPVTYVFTDDPGTLVVAPTIGALVQRWTDILNDGSYRYNGDQWDPLNGPLTFVPPAE